MVGITGASDRSSRNGRRGRTVLVLSLALNLLLAGVVGVWVVRPIFRGPPAPMDFGRVVERMSHRLSETDAAALKKAYAAHRDEMSRLNDEIRNARRKVRDVLQSDSFDPDALKAAMDEVRAARSQLEAAIQNVMREGATAMSPEGRRRLARGPRKAS